MAQYAQVTSISSVSSALPGSQVNVTINIKNLSSSRITILAAAYVDYGSQPWEGMVFDTVETLDVNGGVTAVFRAHFIMPYQAVTLRAESFYFGDDYSFHKDDEKAKVVSVKTEPEPTPASFSNLAFSYFKV